MKPIGVISTAVLLLLVGTNAPTYAQQQDQQDKDRQKQQQDQNRQRDRQGDQDREQQRAQQQQDQKRQRDQDREQQRAQQQQDKDKQKQQGDQNREQQRAQQQQDQKVEQRGQKQQRQQEVDERSSSDQEQRGLESAQRDDWQQHRAHNWHFEHRTWQDRGGYRGYRIPDDRFRDNFGENHAFRIYSRPVVVVGGYPRFQYGGYWFSLVDPWPEYWSDDWYDRDDVYIEHLDDGYYLYDRRYPGDRIAISVYVN